MKHVLWLSIAVALTSVSTALVGCDGADDDAAQPVVDASTGGSSGAGASDASTPESDASTLPDAASGKDAASETGSDASLAAASIESFAAAAPRVTVGNSVQLTAIFIGVSATVDHGVGAIESGVALTTPPLTESTTFVLSVTGADGVVITRALTVDVVAAPSITSFTAATASVLRGQTAVLRAEFSGGTGVVDAEVGAIDSGVDRTTGRIVADTEFHLTVTNELGATASASLAMPVKARLLVSNYSGKRISIFPVDADGNVASPLVLSGDKTGINQPSGLMMVGDLLYVALSADKKVLVFDRFASGNVAPLRTIAGDATGLLGPSGLCTAMGSLFVGDQTTTLKSYPIGASGDVAPTRTIGGGLAALSSTRGCATDATHVFVANSGASRVSVFPLDATGNVAPTRSIATTDPPRSVILDGEEMIMVQETSVDTYSKNTGVLIRSLGGAATGLSSVFQCGLHEQELVCGSFGNASVRTFARAATGNTAPLRTLTSTTGHTGGIGGVLVD